MQLKVCGMRELENMAGLAALAPHFMGFIFYPPSSRFVEYEQLKKSIDVLSANIAKVGVFVNETVAEVINIATTLGLDYVQLHGQESPAYVESVKKTGIGVIKVFHPDASFTGEKTKPYLDLVDFFLFDTPSQQHGGSGRSFDWQVLQNYQEKVPFFLSGGIGLENIASIQNFHHPQLMGIDVNSRFEIAPALKDLKKIEILIHKLRNGNELSSQ